MHGHERCSEDQRDNDNKLYAWVHAVKCEDQGRVLEPIEPEVKGTSHDVRGGQVEFWRYPDCI